MSGLNSSWMKLVQWNWCVVWKSNLVIMNLWVMILYAFEPRCLIAVTFSCLNSMPACRGHLGRSRSSVASLPSHISHNGRLFTKRHQAPRRHQTNVLQVSVTWSATPLFEGPWMLQVASSISSPSALCLRECAFFLARAHLHHRLTWLPTRTLWLDWNKTFFIPISHNTGNRVLTKTSCVFSHWWRLAAASRTVSGPAHYVVSLWMRSRSSLSSTPLVTRLLLLFNSRLHSCAFCLVQWLCHAFGSAHERKPLLLHRFQVWHLEQVLPDWWVRKHLFQVPELCFGSAVV